MEKSLSIYEGWATVELHGKTFETGYVWTLCTGNSFYLILEQPRERVKMRGGSQATAGLPPNLIRPIPLSSVYAVHPLGGEAEAYDILAGELMLRLHARGPGDIKAHPERRTGPALKVCHECKAWLDFTSHEALCTVVTTELKKISEEVQSRSTFCSECKVNLSFAPHNDGCKNPTAGGGCATPATATQEQIDPRHKQQVFRR